jgi:type I restriction enzyme S subunit
MSFLNVPKLRFPEFTDDWEYKQFNELFEFIQTNSLSRANLNYENGKVRNIHYGDIHTKFPTILDCEKFEIPFINPDVNLEKIKDESFCKNGDIVIADASEDYDDIGKAIELKNVNNTKLLAGLHTFLARDQNGFTIEGYRGYMLLNNNFKLQIKKIATGISVLGISKTNLGKLNINIPSIQEQDKIASFLSQVDSKIEKLEKKHELWETYKKGMMQQIFSQKLRFKDDDGDDYPNWVLKRLGDISDIKTGNKDLKDKVDNGEYPFFVRSNNIEKINSYSYDGEAILIPGDGVNVGKIYHYINGKFDYHQRVYKISDFKEGTHGKYIYYYLKKHFLKEALKNSLKGSVDSLRLPTVKKMQINLPTSPEQTRIVNFLSAINKKIETINKVLEINREFKKGLLQQMFPSDKKAD